MRVEVDGHQFDVPDDATPDEIDQITKSAPQDTHGMLAKGAHYAAKALPMAGGIAGGVLGGAGGAPTGIGAIATGAAGAGLGAAGGRALQHFVDQNLGYEQPMGTADAIRDTVGTGLKDAAMTGVTGMGLEVASHALPMAANLARGSSPAAVAERVSALPQSTGAALGESIQALDSTGGQVSKQALAQRFGQLAEEAKAGGPGAAPLVAKFEKAAADIMQDIQTSGQPMMSFKQAEQWKQAYQAPINYAKQTNSPLEMGSKEIASAARPGRRGRRRRRIDRSFSGGRGVPASEAGERPRAAGGEDGSRGRGAQSRAQHGEPGRRRSQPPIRLDRYRQRAPVGGDPLAGSRPGAPDPP
jgi:hypothetical protein